MSWIIALFKPEAGSSFSIAHAVLVLGLVAACGLALGSIRVLGVRLGVAGVLFSGLAFGHFGLSLDPQILEFVRDFGLILFVYTIGVQVGPGFLSSLRRQGLRLNLLAAAIVLVGVAVTVAVYSLGKVQAPAAVGLFSGATTNTPSLAATQQALQDKTLSDELRALPGLGYAIAYPFGVLGVILTMLVLRLAFRIDLQEEKRIFARSEEEAKPRLSVVNLEVQNPNLEGLALEKLPFPASAGVAISRILHEGRVRAARPELQLHLGDTLLAVGPKERLEELRILVGRESSMSLTSLPSDISSRRLIVTQRSALGKTVDELDLRRRYGVVVTRVARADIELPVSPEVRLQFGDSLLAVGEHEGVERAAKELGNSPKQLDHPILVPVFVGIALGVIVGSWPFYFPGVPAAVRLGLAGGPLLVAIVLSRIGKIGPLVWYMPISANFMLREVGISLFLACVGLRAGDRFLATLLQGDGVKWLALAALITLIPPLVVSVLARVAFKLNYLSLCGLLAGSMTDPPALAFVTNATGSEGPSIAYATVYPLTMFLRVLCAQVMILYLL
jgi:putative transport protein